MLLGHLARLGGAPRGRVASCGLSAELGDGEERVGARQTVRERAVVGAERAVRGDGCRRRRGRIERPGLGRGEATEGAGGGEDQGGERGGDAGLGHLGGPFGSTKQERQSTTRTLL